MTRACLLAFALCACGKEATDNPRPIGDAEVRQLFSAQRDSFAALRDLALSEPTAREVGFDRIGECRFEMERWRCDAKAVSEEEALRRAGLTSQRYDRYRALLKQSHATAVRVVEGGVGIIVSSTGISPSGVLKEVRWLPASELNKQVQASDSVNDTDAPASGFRVRRARLDGQWIIERTSN